MKKILLLLLVVFSLSGCVGMSPYVLTKGQTELDLSNNRGVVLFTMQARNPDSARILITNFDVHEINQYKFYNSLAFFDIPITEENFLPSDNLYFCTAVLGSGIYRMGSFNGMTDALFAPPHVLKCDKIFDVYPNSINYLGRFNFGALDTQSSFTQVRSIDNAYEQDVGTFKELFPILRDKEIGSDSFY